MGVRRIRWGTIVLSVWVAANSINEVGVAGRSIGGSSDQFHFVYQQVSGDVDVLARVDSLASAAAGSKAGVMIRSSLEQIGVQPLDLPTGQQDADVGGPEIAGAANYESGAYSITAGGAGIGGTADQFNYVYQPVSGDLDVSVRIDSMIAADPRSQAGVMIRETLSPGSPHAFALVSAGRGFAFRRRAVADGATASSSGAAGGAPAWLRLTRTGSLFTAYQSSDGSTWTAIDSDTITMADPVYVGIAVASHNVAVATDVVADSLALSQNTVYLPPVVSITSPVDGSTFTTPATITITASASDPQNQLTEVDFYNGTSLLGAATTAPYTVSWTSVPAGNDSLTAVAYDAAGLSTQSAPVSVTILDQTLTPPTGVEFLASSDNATVTYYQLDVFNAGDDPFAATPVASLNGGMPTPDASNNMTIMAPDFFGALPSGNYQLTISAVSPAGVGRSVPMAFSQ